MTEPGELLSRIAGAAGCTVTDVEQSFADHGFSLASGQRRRRGLRIDRLRIRGRKAGEVEPGDFDRTFRPGPGVTVIAAGNLRGKTTLLEVLTLALRGEARALQADVLSWLSEVALDVTMSGQSFGFRISLRDSEVVDGRIVSGSKLALEDSDDTFAESVSVLHRAVTSNGWKEAVGTFMLGHLGLEEIQVFNRARADDEPGTIKTHGWSSYFSVIYPPSGADAALLGSTSGDFLPVRLMQVFLDMPGATRWMRARALAKRLESEFTSSQRRAGTLMREYTTRVAEARLRAEAARVQIGALDQAAPVESLEALSELAAQAGRRYGAAMRAAEQASSGLSRARADRVSDMRTLTSLRESAVAGAVFHGLDPHSCPRCESEISVQRKKAEVVALRCAVCDTSIDGAEDDFVEREQAALAALAASRAAETTMSAAVTQTAQTLRQAKGLTADIEARLSKAQAARQAVERAAAERELVSASAALEALETLAPSTPEPPIAVRIFQAAEKVLDEEIALVSDDLYTELSGAVGALGVRFGIGELESVKVKANGHMDVTKGGGATSAFGKQSPGERLRLRYAMLLGLLRVARSRGIAGHPGLLLLDSLKAEELQDAHAESLLEGLVAEACEEADLQILVTTADQALSGRVSGVAATITPLAGTTTMF